MLINVKMPTTVGIFTSMRRIRFWARKKYYNLWGWCHDDTTNSRVQLPWSQSSTSQFLPGQSARTPVLQFRSFGRIPTPQITEQVYNTSYLRVQLPWSQSSTSQFLPGQSARTPVLQFRSFGRIPTPQETEQTDGEDHSLQAESLQIILNP